MKIVLTNGPMESYQRIAVMHPWSLSVNTDAEFWPHLMFHVQKLLALIWLQLLLVLCRHSYALSNSVFVFFFSNGMRKREKEEKCGFNVDRQQFINLINFEFIIFKLTIKITFKEITRLTYMRLDYFQHKIYKRF